MKISKISVQVKNKSRYSVEVDGNYSFSLSADDLLENKIARGDDVDSSKISELKTIGSKSLLYDRVINYLSSRPHSRQEIKTYLYKIITKNKDSKEISRDKKNQIIEEIIEKTESKNYINDLEFAEWFVNQRLKNSKPKSKNIINSELISKGIDREIIQTVFERFPNDFDQNSANLLAEKKLASLEDRYNDPKIIKQKLSTYLMGKGFTWEVVSDTIQSLLSKNPI